jgi:hypothetical protein
MENLKSLLIRRNQNEWTAHLKYGDNGESRRTRLNLQASPKLIKGNRNAL